MKYTAIDRNRIEDICEYIIKTFSRQIPPTIDFVTSMLECSDIDWEHSIKAIDDNGTLMGFILLSDATIDRQSNGIFYGMKPELSKRVESMNYTSIFMVGIEREVSRAGMLNAKMLINQISGYLSGFDFIALSIFSSLTTHRLWQSMGAVELFTIPGQAVFYVVPVQKSVDEIFNAADDDMLQEHRTVIINEDMFSKVEDMMGMTKLKFKSNVMKFLSALLEDPEGSDVNDFLKYNRFTKNKLINKLLNNRIIRRKMTIDDHDSEGNPHTAKMIVRYTVPKDNFHDRLDCLYDELFGTTTNLVINEDGGGAASCSGVDGNGFGSGEFFTRLFGGVRTDSEHDVKKSEKNTTVGGDAYSESVNETADRRSNINYVALELTQDSRALVTRLLDDVVARIGWNDYRTICHHSTLAFHTNIPDVVLDYALENEGRSVPMTVTAIGCSDKAIALHVEYDAPCTNGIKHVMLAVNNDTNGKPVDSNRITDWTEIEPFELTGIVKIYYRDRRINEAVTGDDDDKSAALYVYNEDRDHNWYMLCAKRANRPGDEEGGKWNPPMGHLHKGENMKDGAIRECKEESGIDFSEYKSKITIKDHNPWGSNCVLKLGGYVTPAVTIDDFEPGVGDDENDTFVWLPLEEIDTKDWAWTCGENAKKFASSGIGLNESRKRKSKVVKNDEGKVVPETCTCGGSIGLYICGEPVYKCSKCGKYYGTMSFPKGLNEGCGIIPPEEAARLGFAIPDGDRTWSEGEFVEPRNVGVGYKVFYKGADDQLYPPMIANDNGESTPVGKWLPASSPVIVGYTEKEHRPQVKSGGKGTKGGSGGNLAFRPGWHMGEIPYAGQFMKRQKIDGKFVWPSNLVWAECEYSNDIDYQEEAMSYGYNDKGNFQHSRAGLPKIPKGGSYRYRTNPNPNTVPWIIAGAMRVRRLLTFDEVDEILRDHGVEPPLVMSDKEYKTALAAQQDETVRRVVKESVNEYFRSDGVGAARKDLMNVDNTRQFGAFLRSDKFMPALAKLMNNVCYFSSLEEMLYDENLGNDLVEFISRYSPSFNYDNSPDDEYIINELVEILETNHDAAVLFFMNFTRSWAYRLLECAGESLSNSTIMDYDGNIKKNVWIVHGTNAADAIANNGFDYGVGVNGLAYTKDNGTERGGNLFYGYLADDEEIDYVIGDENGIFKYGKSFILCQANAIEIYHHGDSEKQVIFDGRTAHNVIRIEENYRTGELMVMNRDDEPVYETRLISDIIEWCKTNLQQYRRQITWDDVYRHNNHNDPVSQIVAEKYERDWKKGRHEEDDDYPEVVEIQGQYNYRTNDGRILIPDMLFDYCGKFSYGVGVDNSSLKN